MDDIIEVKLSIIKQFLNGALKLEDTLTKIDNIISREDVNTALIKNPNIPVIKALLDIKDLLKDLP